MTNNLDKVDLFCRLNVQSEMPHDQFVAFVARSIGAVSRMSSITSDTLDISVDDNDVFDLERSHSGADRWLYFRYTMEIDPVKGVSSADYIAAVSSLLQALWESHMDAVAACEFEEILPLNPQRLNWAINSPPRDENLNGIAHGNLPASTGRKLVGES